MVVAAELALGVEASDAGVELGSLMLVDPAGRDPFREAIGIDITDAGVNCAAPCVDDIGGEFRPAVYFAGLS